MGGEKNEQEGKVEVDWRGGVMEGWSDGVLECGVMEYWSDGVMEYWSDGVMEIGMMEYWSNVSSE